MVLWMVRNNLSKTTCMIALLGVLGVANMAGGQTVYTWIGKNGTRHYSDVPAAPDAKVLNLTALSVVAFRVSDGKVSAAKSKGSTKRSAADRKRQAAAGGKLKAYCQSLRSNIQKLVSARRVVLHNKGKVTYLTGANVQRYRKRLKALYSRYCST